MKIDIRTNVAALIKDFGTMQNKQVGFATGWAMRAIERDVAQAARNRIQRQFKASPQGMAWMLRHVKVLSPGGRLGKLHVPQDGPTKHRGFIGIIPPESKGDLAGWRRYRGSLLAMMERGGATPGPRDFGGVIGLGRYGVQFRRPTDRTPVPQSMFPIRLGLQARRRVEGGLLRGGLQGKRRTYMLRTGANAGTIFQRFGKGRGDTMPLFFTTANAQLPARHYFFPSAELVVRTRFTHHFTRAMQHALFGRGMYRG